MKRYGYIAAMAIIMLSGCTQRLDAQDRALITATHDLAEQAQKDAAQAAQEAKAAREEAEKAAASAKASSEKSDRIFRQGQDK